ncbi:MAG: dTDP-4-dehydrorhamnose reductase [Actinobacteria bacterium]|nr:dTDP-4-dehydrorhamnose reductase [Actinomycetota bacterium]|tara:strand:+ start:3922 stop:4761 length:840 start_codon:yes stop_codon:yes gene_type:complete
MRILITGGDGQVGKAFSRNVQKHELFACSRSELDISNSTSILKAAEKYRPDIIINCGALTDVDKCETSPDLAMEINGHAVGLLAEQAEKCGASLVQISTDYVFDGEKDGPYLETDLTKPISIYGQSKLLGEQLAGSGALVVRTSWVMSLDGNNILVKILRLLNEGGELKFVDDQIGCPTFTDDLVDAVIKLVESKVTGVVHVTNCGSTSWFDFAQLVAECAGSDPKQVSPISGSELNRPARRPKNSILENRRLTNLGFPQLPHYIDSLEQLISKEQRQF